MDCREPYPMARKIHKLSDAERHKRFVEMAHEVRASEPI